MSAALVAPLEAQEAVVQSAVNAKGDGGPTRAGASLSKWKSVADFVDTRGPSMLCPGVEILLRAVPLSIILFHLPGTIWLMVVQL